MFPSDSAWEDQRARESREADRDIPPVQPEQPERSGGPLGVGSRTTRSVPIDVLEEWVNKLEDIAWDTPDAIAADGLADEIRAFLPG
jgi:hypothetical protein